MGRAAMEGMAMNAPPSPLRVARDRLRISQKELGRRVGCTRAEISLIETGRVKDPGTFITWRIAHVLGVRIEEIFPYVLRGLDDAKDS